MMSYDKMALVYDVLMEDAPYDQWVSFTENMFAEFGVNISSVADLGCGTGQITRRLAKKGYELYGVDFSSEMLTYAEQASHAEQLDIQWIQQDLRRLNKFPQMDAAISYCDVINYITDESEIKQVFHNVHEILKDKGLFLFDVHSINHVESDLKGETFAEIYDDLSYVWLCQPGEHQGEVVHELTFFVQDQLKYDRFDETHHQRTFPIDKYEDLLVDTGFIIRGVYADFSTTPLQTEEDTNSERIFFVCQKK